MGRTEPKKVMETDETDRFVRYKEIVGTGSSKIVFRGYDRQRSMEVAWSRVAMKGFSKQDHTSISKEISMLANMDHPNVLKLFAWWLNPGSSEMILICELFYAGNLKHHIRRFGRPTIDTVRRWGTQVLEGLQYLHERAPGAPIIHRDLKCENLFIHGHTGVVKIGDLGLATVQDASRFGQSATVVGTANFMSPELFEGAYTLKADIYAFGMCLYEMYTGKTPYDECQHIGQIFRKIITGERPNGLADLDDEDLVRVINSCLLPETSRPTAAQLLQDRFFKEHEQLSWRTSDAYVDKELVASSPLLVKTPGRKQVRVKDDWEDLSSPDTEDSATSATSRPRETTTATGESTSRVPHRGGFP